MNFKKIGICWDRALVLRKQNLPGRGLTKVEKQWHIRRWSHKIMILQYNIILFTIVLQLHTVFSTVTCCTGL